MRRYTCALLAAAVGVLCITSLAGAQQAGGSAIQGRVTDTQQAVLPGVTLVITNQENGTFRETITGPEGTYFVTGLSPGVYRITADLSGFKKLTRQDVNIQLGNTQTVELQLEVGGLAETVTVSGEAPVVDLTTAQVGGNVTSQELTQLPSPTRNFIAFVAMLPGVQYNPSSEGSDSISINGQSSNQVNFVLDGGNNTDDNSASPSGAQARAPLEAVEEFQIVTNQFDVEFGRSTGGIVNAITKRGSNTFRGSAFGYVTNSGMTSPTLFVKQSNGALEEPETSKHQWGGTIGGPIVKDKLHFFFSYERYVLGQGLTNVFPTRPDLNLTQTQGLNGSNYMIRADHQISNAHTWTFRYLTERQPNRNLFSGDTATATSGNYELDIDQTASAAWNWVLGTRMLNTLRFSIETEDIRRGAEPGTFLETNDKTLEAPVLNHLSFTEQGHSNGQHRFAMAPGIDDSFSWFVPGKGGDHDLKFGFQYLFAQNDLDEQGNMNGTFSFASDKPFNAGDPSTYPERLSIRVPGPGGQSTHVHSLGLYWQDKWRMTKKLTLNLGLRYDVDVFPYRQELNPLLTDPGYPVDKNNFQPRAGFAYNVDGRSVVHGGIGRYYEKFFVGQASTFQSSGVFGNSFSVSFPVSSADPGPSRGNLPTDPMLVNGPTVNRDRLKQLFPQGTVTRNTGGVQFDTPDRQMPRSTQVSLSYERQLGKTMSFGVDYVHNEGRNWITYDLNPGLKPDTGRTTTPIRTDLLGLAAQLGISAFSSSVSIREYTGKTKYDGLSFSSERRFSGFWSARATYTLGYARGNNGGAAAAGNGFQVLADRHLELNEGPLDTDRRHNMVLNSRVEVPRIKGLTVSALLRVMSGRPFTITDSNVDADRNGSLSDPLPAGTYSGVGQNALTVKNDGGRNGAYGPHYAQMDVRLGYRVRLRGNRTLDIFAEEFNVTNHVNFSNPGGDRRLTTFLIGNALVGGGFPRQMQVGTRLGF